MRFPVAVAVACVIGAGVCAAGCSPPHRTLAIVPTLPRCVPATAVNTVRVTAQGDFAALPGLTASASAMQDATLNLPRETRVVDVQGFGPDGVVAAFGRTAPLASLDDVTGDAIGLAYGPPDGICATAQLNDARALQSATLLPSGEVLVAGGYDGAGVLTSIERYLPDGDGATPAAQFARVATPLDADGAVYHAVAVLADGGVLISGGAGIDAVDGAGRSAIAFMGALRLRSDGSQYSAHVLPGSGRLLHSATTLADGRVLIAGGCAELLSGGCLSGRVVGSTIIYDPAEDSFAGGPTLVHPRFGHSAVLRGDGTVLLAGGSGEGGAVVPAEIVDVANARAFDAGPSSGAAVGLAPGPVLVVGAGTHAGIWLGPTETELPLPDLPTALPAPPLLASLDDGGVLIVGAPAPGQPVEPLVFDGRASIMAPGATLPFMPGTATRLGDGTVLLAGGPLGAPTKQAALYFRSPLSPFASLAPLTLDATSDPYLPRRYDRAVAGNGELVATVQQPLGDGRPAELALIAGMKVADFDFDLLAGRNGAATAALLVAWQSDAAYAFVTLAPGQPVTLSAVSAPPPGAVVAKPVSGCRGASLLDGELPDGTLAHLHVSWRNGTFAVTSARTLLSCRPATPLARGQVGVGSIGGSAAFGNLSLSR